MNSVTVIIPNWNRRALLARALESVRGQTCAPAEILVVDGGSTDGSAELAAAWGVRVIRLARNEGFCRAVNAGIREARTEWVAVLNNDVTLAPDWLELLLDSARRWNASFATGKIFSAAEPAFLDGTFDALCVGGCSWRAGYGRPDGPIWLEPRSIRFAPLTAALLRTELFEAVGLLDERFGSYLEDVEFGLRCSLAGYEGIYVPGARCFHTGSATWGGWSPEMVRLISRNQLLLVAKHYPSGLLWRSLWRIVVAQVLWGLLAARRGAGRAWIQGKLEALRTTRHMRPAARSNPPDSRLREVLEASERQIHDLQQETGFDWYWRLYFALT